MLLQTEAARLQHEVTRLTAVVRKQNATSLRLFAGVGFEEASSDHEVVHLVKRL